MKQETQNLQRKIIQKDFNIDVEKEILRELYHIVVKSKFSLSEIEKMNIDLLIHYFNGSNLFNNPNRKYKLDKGLLFAGSDIEKLNAIFDMFQKYTSIRNLQFRFVLIKAEAIVDSYDNYGFDGYKKYIRPLEVWDKYSNNKKQLSLCIQNLGEERVEGKSWGKNIDVIKKVIDKRYDLSKSLIYTHATTKHTTAELYKRYGDEHYKILSNMFNYISFD